MIDLYLFGTAALALLIAPGPTNTLLATVGALSSVRRAVPHLLATLLAYALAIVAYRSVLAPVLSAAPWVSVALKLVVAAYVTWLAIKLWAAAVRVTDRPVPVRDVFVATLFNPKGLVLALVLLPADASNLLPHAVVLAAIAATSSLLWIALGRLIIAGAGDRGRPWIGRSGSVVLVGFAGLIAASALG